MPHVGLPGLIGEKSHDGAEHVTDEVFNAASHLMGGMLSVLGQLLITSQRQLSSAVGLPLILLRFGCLDNRCSSPRKSLGRHLVPLSRFQC